MKTKFLHTPLAGHDKILYQFIQGMIVSTHTPSVGRDDKCYMNLEM